MSSDTIARIIRAFAGRWLDKAETDTKRCLRKLVEFGSCFSGSERQRKFFIEARRILNDNKSKYYFLAKNLFKSVDKNRLIEFGLMFGYYGLDRGIKKADIYMTGANSEYCLAIMTKYNAGDAGALDTDKWLSELSQDGSSIFFIFCNSDSIQGNELKTTIDKYPQKAFFLFTDRNEISEINCQNNVMPVINLLSENYNFISESLKKQRRLFGGYCRYNDATADELISKSFLEKVYESGCLFLFLCEDDECSKSCHDKINSFSYNQKRKPTYPIFITELKGDLKWLNNVAGEKKYSK